MPVRRGRGEEMTSTRKMQREISRTHALFTASRPCEGQIVDCAEKYSTVVLHASWRLSDSIHSNSSTTIISTSFSVPPSALAPPPRGVPTTMPLDTTSTYSTTLLRQDGRRWNELRKFSASISTQPSADGSSLITMGNTSVVCTITGPREGRGQGDRTNAVVETEINIAPFAQLDRRRAGRTDKRVQELQTTISQAFQAHLFTHLYPRSSILISLIVLSLDGGLLSTCLNAASIALVDAGVPMPSILASITTGTIMPTDNTLNRPEPILDLNNAEEVELPFMSLATVRGDTGAEDQISVLLMETRVQMSEVNNPLEIMLGIGLDGCAQVRSTLEETVRRHGRRVMQGRR